MKKAFLGLAAMLLIAACTAAPPPVPGNGAGNPPPAPSDTPAIDPTDTSAPGDEASAPYPVEPESGVDDTGYPAPIEDNGYPAPDALNGYPAPAQGDCSIESAAPQRHELTTADDVTLVGTFYPAADCSAPIVVLFHQFGSSKESWTDLALWMQNRTDENVSLSGVLASPSVQYGWFPALPEGLSLAVFAVDFRDHGESQKTNSDLDEPGFLLDAQTAFDYARLLPNVDPNRVITMGTSIGSDASVDVCLALDGNEIAADQINKGCIGAMSFSPGSYLGVSYSEVLTRLADAPFNLLIHCVATEFDGGSPDLCSADLPGNIQFTVYPNRSEHGIALLQDDFDPNIGLVIQTFLLEALSIDG